MTRKLHSSVTGNSLRGEEKSPICTRDGSTKCLRHVSHFQLQSIYSQFREHRCVPWWKFAKHSPLRGNSAFLRGENLSADTKWIEKRNGTNCKMGSEGETRKFASTRTPVHLYVCSKMSVCLMRRETDRGKRALRVNSLACRFTSFFPIFSLPAASNRPTSNVQRFFPIFLLFFFSISFLFFTPP